jgi:hypothetical protein
MAALIKEEGLDEDGRPMKHRNLRQQQKRKRKQTKKVPQEDNEDDSKDGEFSDSSSDDGSSSGSESDESDNTISNDEVCFSLYYIYPSLLTHFFHLDC